MIAITYSAQEMIEFNQSNKYLTTATFLLLDSASNLTAQNSKPWELLFSKSIKIPPHLNLSKFLVAHSTTTIFN